MRQPINIEPGGMMRLRDAIHRRAPVFTAVLHPHGAYIHVGYHVAVHRHVLAYHKSASKSVSLAHLPTTIFRRREKPIAFARKKARYCRQAVRAKTLLSSVKLRVSKELSEVMKYFFSLLSFVKLHVWKEFKEVFLDFFYIEIDVTFKETWYISERENKINFSIFTINDSLYSLLFLRSLKLNR